MRYLRRYGIGVFAVIFGVTGAQADTIRFGAILPLTGPGAMIGTQQMRGIQFAVEKANAAGGVHGNTVEILFEDNQAKPDQSILSFNRLADLRKVPMIFTAAALRMARQYRQLGLTFARQYYNATQIVLAVTDRLLAEGKKLTGETMHDMLFTIGKFQGLIPLEFKSNTATVPLNINVMKGGKDVTIKQISSE